MDNLIIKELKERLDYEKEKLANCHQAFMDFKAEVERKEDHFGGAMMNRKPRAYTDDRHKECREELAAYKADVEPVLRAAMELINHGLAISVNDPVDALIISLNDAIENYKAAQATRNGGNDK